MKQVLCYPYLPDEKAEASPIDLGSDSLQQVGKTDFQLMWSASEWLLWAIFLSYLIYHFFLLQRSQTKSQEAKSSLR